MVKKKNQANNWKQNTHRKLRRINFNLLKVECDIICSGWVCISCFTCNKDRWSCKYDIDDKLYSVSHIRRITIHFNLGLSWKIQNEWDNNSYIFLLFVSPNKLYLHIFFRILLGSTSSLEKKKTTGKYRILQNRRNIYSNTDWLEFNLANCW